MNNVDNSLDHFTHDLQVYIEMSFQQEDISLKEWIAETSNKLDVNCWEIKKCKNLDCPAYNNECSRCWLIAGTMCGGSTIGTFAQKYHSCMACDFYKSAVGGDSVDKLREMVIILIHNLREKQAELRDALFEVKTLSGLIPICASCKDIRDDQGYWKRVEEYIGEHSDAKFSHSVCPSCAKRLYPDL